MIHILIGMLISALAIIIFFRALGNDLDREEKKFKEVEEQRRKEL